MRIVINEIKKILNMRSLLILSVITILMFLRVIIPMLNSRDNLVDVNNMSLDMYEKYGESIEKEEFMEFKGVYETKVEEANNYINENGEFKELGVYNYEEFYKITRNSGEEKYNNPKLHELYWKYVHSEDLSLFGELSDMENIIITYEHSVLGKNIEENSSYTSPLPYTFFQTYNDVVRQQAALIILSVVFLISPVFFNDKNENMEYLQYSSKYGRKLFKSKVVASLITSLLVSLVQVFLFIVIYSNMELKGSISVFLDCSVSGWFNSPMISWYDITFREYMIITCICAIAIGVVFSLISAFISSKVNSFVSLIGIQVPIVILCNLYLLKFILNYVTSMYISINGIGSIYVDKYYTPRVYITLIIASVIIVISRYRKVKKIDII